MAENLKTTKYRNGDLIGTTSSPTLNIVNEATTAKYQWVYEGNENNVAVYGRLYTWYAVTDSRTICPVGWHIPSESEWLTLTDFLAPDNVVGGKMKETGTAHWSSPNEGATNETGFTALPGGYRNNDGSFDGIGYAGYWWSATEDFANNALSRVIQWINSNMSRNTEDKGYGFSVRCVRD